MNIGDAARATGLTEKTIRYSEGIDLVVADRSGNVYRNYSDAHAHKLQFVERVRRLGFSIEVCRVLLPLYEG